LQGLGDAKAGHVDLSRRGDQHIARMQRTMMDARRYSRVERLRDLPQDGQGLPEAAGGAAPDAGIESISADVLLCEPRRASHQARGVRADDARMRRKDATKTAESIGKIACPLRSEVESQDFDRNFPFAGGIVRAKDRAEDACANLVQDAIGSNRGRWRKGARVVVDQGRTPEAAALASRCEPQYTASTCAARRVHAGCVSFLDMVANRLRQ
jgi:hypothetical protein